MLIADELFQELQGEAHKFSRCCTLSVEDIRQELYLMCIEVSGGKSSYNPILGTVREYIMGRLWGLIRRWRESSSLPDEVDGDAITPICLQVQSVEDQLIGRQDREDRETALNVRNKTRPNKLQTSLIIPLCIKHYTHQEHKSNSSWILTQCLLPGRVFFFTLDALSNGFPCDAQELRRIPSRQDIADDIE